MSITTGIVLGVLAVGLLVLSMARRGRSGDLGSVSSTWVIENRADHHDRG